MRGQPFLLQLDMKAGRADARLFFDFWVASRLRVRSFLTLFLGIQSQSLKILAFPFFGSDSSEHRDPDGDDLNRKLYAFK